MTTIFRKIAITTLPGALGLALATSAVAQDYPSDTVRFILHAGPGGGTDNMARVLAAGLEDMGWNIVVENREGGSTANQLAILTRAQPDGYTLGSVTASGIGVWNRSLKQYGVDKVDWVVSLVEEPYLIAVNPASGIETFSEFVDYAKANPGAFSVAVSQGRGSSSHMMWEIVAEATGIPSESANVVVYSTMTDVAVQLLGGHVDAIISFVDTVQAHAEAGNMNLLAVFSEDRISNIPDVPTAQEAGFDIFTGWAQFRGIIAPKGTPLEIRQTIADAVMQVSETERWKQYLEDAALSPSVMGPEEFTTFAYEQNEVTKRWLTDLGLDN